MGNAFMFGLRLYRDITPVRNYGLKDMHLPMIGRSGGRLVKTELNLDICIS